MVSIIVPAYNAGKYIAETLDSAIGKGEIIVAYDEGSTDNTLEIINRFPVDKLISHPHSFVSVARNKAIAAASNPYIVQIDADDILLDVRGVDILDTQTGVGVVYGNYINFGDSSGHMIPNQSISLEQFRSNNQLYTTSLIRKSAWESIGGYWEDCWYAEDWDFWGRLMKHGWRFEYLDHDFAKHRIHNDSLWETQKRDGVSEEGARRVIEHIFS